jgi:hypothetical protein
VRAKNAVKEESEKLPEFMGYLSTHHGTQSRIQKLRKN